MHRCVCIYRMHWLSSSNISLKNTLFKKNSIIWCARFSSRTSVLHMKCIGTSFDKKTNREVKFIFTTIQCIFSQVHWCKTLPTWMPWHLCSTWTHSSFVLAAAASMNFDKWWTQFKFSIYFQDASLKGCLTSKLFLTS